MSLAKSVGTIGGLTAVSRVFGFARDMLMARVVGAGLVADAFQLAFTLPNTFRRLFAEGAFSVAFVPMYSRALHGAGDAAAGEEQANRFANDVLSVFVWVLLAFSALAMIFMPALVWLLADDFAKVPGKFDLAVFLSRITFPYLGFISLMAMLAGVLNARSRFGPAAFAPVLLNVFLITAILTGNRLRGEVIELTSKYGDGYVNVKVARAKLSNVESAIRDNEAKVARQQNRDSELGEKRFLHTGWFFERPTQNQPTPGGSLEDRSHQARLSPRVATTGDQSCRSKRSS